MDGASRDDRDLQEQYRLGPELYAAFQHLASIVRQDLTRLPAAKEAALVEILDHVLEAEKHGHSAENIFGTDVEAYGQEVLASLPAKPGTSRFAPIVSALLPTGCGVLAAAILVDQVLGTKSDSDVLNWNARKLIVTLLVATVIATVTRATRWPDATRPMFAGRALVPALFAGGVFSVLIGDLIAPGRVLPTRTPVVAYIAVLACVAALYAVRAGRPSRFYS
jgi:hypothetical protein